MKITDSDDAQDIYASVDCINNDDEMLGPQTQNGLKLLIIAGTAQNLT